MKVCIETSTFRVRFAGIAYFAWFLARHMIDRHPEIDLWGFDGGGFRKLDEDYLSSSLTANGTAALSSHTYQRLREIPMMRQAFRAYKQRVFMKGVTSFDLFHAVNSAPPRDPDVPVLPLVHDVSHKRYPQTHPAERVAWLDERLGNLGRFPLVNTVSHFSAREISELLDFPIERIRVSYPGVDPLFRRPAEAAALASLERWGLRPRGFFLTVGTIEPRKNHRVLVEAYSLLPRAFRIEHPLVFVGQPGWGRLETPNIEHLRKEGSLIFTGYVDRPCLRALHAQATAMLFPTLYEGFGIPVAEAMAAGLPVVASDIEVMREVAHPVARFVAPTAAEAWCQAIRDMADLADGDRAALSARSIQASQKFNWDATAASVADIYRELVPRHALAG